MSREAYRRHRDPLSGAELLWFALLAIGTGVGVLLIWFAMGWV